MERNRFSNSSSFKAAVLAAVLAIPKGETRTYREVAEAAGSPRAYRAVGSIMKHNKDKRIPCHRVVRSDGPGSYNGLLGASKPRLLAREAYGR